MEGTDCRLGTMPADEGVKLAIGLGGDQVMIPVGTVTVDRHITCLA